MKKTGQLSDEPHRYNRAQLTDGAWPDALQAVEAEVLTPVEDSRYVHTAS